MSQSSFARLFWKEYRTQRSVWLALLAGTVLLQVVLAVSLGPRLLGPGAIVLALVLSACYAAACAGILFAGEREEETDLCLRQLPLRAVPLLGAKLLFAVTMVPAFVGAALLGAWAVSEYSRIPTGEALTRQIEFFARAVAGSLVWGLFFSLLMRRVLVVVLCTAISELVVVAIASNIAQDHPHRAYFAILAGVACMDLWLGLRWAAGDVVLPLPRVRLFAGRPERAASPRWEKLLAWGARRGTQSSRTCAALCWRELRAAAPFCTWWALLGVLLVDLLPRLFGIPSHVLFLAATPAVCGLMVGLPDQRRQTYRFLSERGVPAATVWFSKQAVWLALAVAIVAVFAAWDTGTPGRIRGAGSGEDYRGVGPVAEILRHAIHLPYVALQIPMDTAADRALRWNFAAALCLTLFAVGQLASLWIRRAVLAAVAALIGAVLLGVGLTALVKSDVPLTLGAWPVALAWLAGTWLLSARWLRGDNSWRTRLGQWAWVVLPVVGVATASASYRAHQAPLVSPGFQWPAHEYQRDQFDRAQSQPWQELLFSLQRKSRLAPSEARAHEESADAIADRVLALGQAPVAGRRNLDPLLLRPGDDYALVHLGAAVADSARRKEGAGLESSWNEILAGLRVTRILARQCADWQTWSAALVSRSRLLTETRRWAAHPGQTPESLRSALESLTEETREPILAHDMLKNRYIFYRQLLEHRGRAWDKDETLRIPGAQSQPAFVCASLPVFERERIQRLISLATSRSLGESVQAGGSFPHPLQLARWRASTPLLPPDFHAELTGVQSYPQAAVDELKICQTQAYAARIVLALELYRLTRGAYPESLDALVGPDVPVLPHDPFSASSGWFGYAPEGFPAPVFILPGQFVPRDVPLLWSTGLHTGQIIKSIHGDSMSSARIPAGDYYATNWNARGAYPTSFIRSEDRQGTPSERSNSRPSIRFSILGLSLDDEWDYALPDEAVPRPRDGAP